MRLDEEALLAKEKPMFSSLDQPVGCTTRKNIVFLYAHATDGEILKHIILSHANNELDNNGPLAVLPANDKSVHVGNYPDTIQLDDLKPLNPNSRRSYGVLAHHTRWNYDSMLRIMSNDTVYVTLVQDPVAYFRFRYDDRELRDLFNVSLERLALDRGNATYKRNGGKFERNQMAFDLGADVEAIENNASAIWQLASRLNGQFHLVALADQMEESLILLKDIMCWSLDDVVSLTESKQTDFSADLDPKVATGLERRNLVDKIIYDYFGTELRKRIADFGAERMALEKSRLAERTRLWRGFCERPEIETSAMTSPVVGDRNETRIELTSEGKDNAKCLDLTKSTAQLTEELRKKQTSFLQ